MEKKRNLSLVLMLLMGMGMAFAQEDISAVKVEGPAIRFVSVQFGGGGATRGIFFNTVGSMVFSSYVGFAVDANIHLSHPKDVPSDYISLFPQNILRHVSMRVVKEIPSRNPKALFRWGLEAGPSIYDYSSVIIGENNGGCFLCGKYITTRKPRQGVGLGLSFRAKVVPTFVRTVGPSLALLANFNGNVPYAGMELSVFLGKLTDRR